MNETYNDHAADMVLAGQIARIIKRDRGEVLKAMRREPFMRRLALANRRRRQSDEELSDEEKQRIADEDASRNDDGWRLELRQRGRKGFQMPDRQQVLRGLMKSAGGDVVSLAKRIVADGGSDVSEAELTELITAHAKALYPGLSEAQAFLKVFEAEKSLRRAIEVAKGYPFTRDGTVGGEDAGEDSEDDDDSDDVELKLKRLAEKRFEHAAGTKSYAKCFAEVYGENAQLAKRERKSAHARLRGAA